MDIRPCDVQMFINKSSDNNKTNNDTLKYNELYQNLSYEFKKNTENETKKTNQLNKTEGETIDNNKKGSQQFYNEKNDKKKKVKKEEVAEKSKKQKESYIFDVSI